MRERCIATVFVLAVAGILLLPGIPAGAQQLTGAIEGTVKDATAGCFPGLLSS